IVTGSIASLTDAPCYTDRRRVGRPAPVRLTTSSAADHRQHGSALGVGDRHEKDHSYSRNCVLDIGTCLLSGEIKARAGTIRQREAQGPKGTSDASERRNKG